MSTYFVAFSQWCGKKQSMVSKETFSSFGQFPAWSGDMQAMVYGKSIAGLATKELTTDPFKAL